MMTHRRWIAGSALLGVVGIAFVSACAERSTAAAEYVTALSASATVLDIGQGASDAVTVTLERDRGYEGDVVLRVEALPPELTVQLDRTSLRGSESQARLTVTAPANAPVARYTFRVRALAQNGSSRVSTITVNVKRVGFRLALGAVSASATQRESGSIPVTVVRDAGYLVPTILTVEGVPTDVSARFTVQTLAAGMDRSDLILTPGLATLPGPTRSPCARARSRRRSRRPRFNSRSRRRRVRSSHSRSVRVSSRSTPTRASGRASS